MQQISWLHSACLSSHSRSPSLMSSVSVSVSMLSLALVFLLSQPLSILSQCNYPSEGIDFSSLKGTELTCNFDQYTLVYTPCDNDVKCYDGFGTPSYMVVQRDQSFGDCVAFLASTDNSVQPKHIKVNGADAYRFEYTNGESKGSCFPRNLDLEVVCDPKAHPYGRTECEEEQPCYYLFRVYTNKVCSGGGGSSEVENMSGGWIFILILVIGLILYIVIGYAINGFRSKDWGNYNDNIPNLVFWKALPALVTAGCHVSKEFIQSKISGDKGDAEIAMTGDDE